MGWKDLQITRSLQIWAGSVAVLLFVYDEERMVGWMDGTDGRREETMDGRKDRWKVFHQ